MIALSNRQIKNADRVGGIDLVIAWPKELPLGQPLLPDEERDATPTEETFAFALVAGACRAANLVPVRIVVAAMKRPTGMPRSREVHQHLVITIIGARWVHARGGPRPLTMWNIKEDA